MLRDSSHSAVAPGQCHPQTKAESTPQFAFLLHAPAFTPGTLSVELVAQGLSPLRHLPDLSIFLQTWGE